MVTKHYRHTGTDDELSIVGKVAYGQEQLATQGSLADILNRIVRRQDQADAWRDSRPKVGLSLQLIAIVQRHFAKPLDIAEVVRHRVRELVHLTV